MIDWLDLGDGSFLRVFHEVKSVWAPAVHTYGTLHSPIGLS